MLKAQLKSVKIPGVLWQVGAHISCTDVFLCIRMQSPGDGLFTYPMKLGVGVIPVPPPTSREQQHPWGTPGWTWHLSCKPVCAAVCIPGLFWPGLKLSKENIKKTFACFQLKSAVYYASRMVRSELVSFQLREGLWTRMSYL